MTLTPQQNKLLQFVQKQHGAQLRKYTNEPYWNHCVSVAEIAAPHLPNTFAVEVALCHDLFEDTQCTFQSLYNNLVEFDYSREDAYDICTWTKQLTDVFTSESHSYMNREKRKAAEAERLGLISPLAQSVKYADLIDNTSSIVQHDKGFAKIYLKEKERILSHMTGGDVALRSACYLSLSNAQLELSKTN